MVKSLLSISASYSHFLNPWTYMRILLSSFSFTPITTIVIRRFTMLYGIILPRNQSSYCNSWWQALNQVQSFLDFVKKFYGMLWENGSVSQHHHFLHDKSLYNQIKHALKKCVFLMSLYLMIFQKEILNRFQRWHTYPFVIKSSRLLNVRQKMETYLQYYYFKGSLN